MKTLKLALCALAFGPVIALAPVAVAQSGPWFQPIPFFPFNMPPPTEPLPPPGKAYVDPYVEQPAPPPKPKAVAKPALSCDKAKAIVADYGFTDIEPQTCKGKVYAFGAKRDGKSFSVKLSSASGELTEVKRL